MGLDNGSAGINKKEVPRKKGSFSKASVNKRKTFKSSVSFSGGLNNVVAQQSSDKEPEKADNRNPTLYKTMKTSRAYSNPELFQTCDSTSSKAKTKSVPSMSSLRKAFSSANLKETPPLGKSLRKPNLVSPHHSPITRPPRGRSPSPIRMDDSFGGISF
ncbi:MAG: hypothetical protein MK137_05360 [Rickettsiales bacterium]|nr:hypothetical protein [Rickettsiales bacterium]